MADVEINISGNLTAAEVTESQPSSKPMSLPVKLNLSGPAAQEWLNARRQNLKPWLLFFQKTSFQMPVNPAALGGRIVRNVDYFQSNYLCIFILLIFYCLITSPLLLFAVGASLGACYILSKRQAEKKMVIMGHELSLAQQYGLVSLCSFPLFYLAGAGSAVFWVLGATLFFVLLHASLFNIESTDDSFSSPMMQQV